MVLALVLTACAAQSQGVSSDGSRILTVNGNAQVPVEPDTAYVTIGVHSSDKDVAKAVNENNRLIETVKLKLVDDFGVSEIDTQTANFNLWTSDQYDLEGQHTGVLYTVDNTMYVTVRDLDDLGNILDEVISNGANSIFGVQFDLADKSSALNQARNQAVANAKTQASGLAEAADLTLGKIQSVSFFGGASPSVYYGGIGGGGGSVADQAVPISAGQLMLSVDVSITYSITE